VTPGTGGDTPGVWLGLSGSSRAGLGSGYSGLEAALGLHRGLHRAWTRVRVRL
jgi:hypothetical protein